MGRIVDISEALLILGLSSGATEEERAIVSYSITAAEGAILRALRYDPVYALRTEYYPAMDTRRTASESVWEVSDTAAYERVLSDSRSDELQVRHLPVRGIQALYIDYDGRAGTKSGAFAASTQKIEGSDFWANYDAVDSEGGKICRDGIIRSQGLWPMQAGSVKILYYSGYKSAELRGQDTSINASPIWETCLEEIQHRVLKTYSRMKKEGAGFSGPLSSERLGDYSYSINQQANNALLGAGDLLPESMARLEEYMNYGIQLSS